MPELGPYPGEAVTDSWLVLTIKKDNRCQESGREKKNLEKHINWFDVIELLMDLIQK